jgi:DNA polymerase beta
MILSNFNTIYEKHKINKEVWKANAYKSAINKLTSLDTPITCVEELGSLKFGKSLQEKAIRIVEMRCDLDEAIQDESVLQKNASVVELSGVHNIGYTKAVQLVDKHGITCVDDLMNNLNLLNDKQIMGLKFHKDIIQNIPYKEMLMHENVVLTHLSTIFPGSTNISVSLVGSFRRKQKSSGDIDIILSSSDGIKIDMSEVINGLKETEYILANGIFALGEKKFMGMCNLGGKSSKKYTNRRVDILIASASEYPFALLYFTGSCEFNVLMRERAKGKGYTLNEKGIFHEKTKIACSHVFNREKDIFVFLGIKYVDPMNRYKDNFEIV